MCSVNALGVAEVKSKQLSLPLAENDNDAWLSTNGAAKILGVTSPTLRNWVYVAGLFRPDVKVEIEAIAAVE